MGCECLQKNDEADLYTSKITPENLKINIISIPEEDQIESKSMPLELSLLIKSKFNKVNKTPIKFISITSEEFIDIQNRNTYAKEIINQYTPQLNQINYENDVKYQNIPPIRVIDPEGGSQYYQGGYNSRGECHGKGIWIRDYDIYIGNFRNDQLINNGNFKNGKREGYGEEKYNEGDEYKGAFFNDEKCGKGQYIFADGSRYDGNFRNNKFNGFGQISLNNGDFIRGEFKNGKLNGEGDVNWKDGTKFVGNFVKGKKYGVGTYISNDGQIYKATWEDDDLYESNVINDINMMTI